MLDLPDKLSRHLYMSKVACFQTCPRKYYWQHHLHLSPKDRPIYYTFGSALHRAVELGHLYGQNAADCFLLKRADVLKTLVPNVTIDEAFFSKLDGLSEKDIMLLQIMNDAFWEKWKQLGVKRILSIEASVKHNVSPLTDFFDDWIVKGDFLFELLNETMWVGDLKTTSGYGAQVAKYYHSSPQTKTYFHILQQKMPKLVGTKILVVTKQKVRCEEETITINDNDRYQAELFINEAVRAIDSAELSFSCHQDVDHAFPRYMTACISSHGQECPFIPICVRKVTSMAYIEDLINNWYCFSDPDEHLELAAE